MANYSADNQITYTIQWFRTWSDFQKDDFVHILAHKISPTQFINGIVNGMQNLDTSGRPPSLFSCQIKLFKEWWDTWNEEGREKFKAQVKDSDPKFWTEVESELSGSRKKQEDDFFTVAATATTATISDDEGVVQSDGEIDIEQATEAVEEVTEIIQNENKTNGIEKLEEDDTINLETSPASSPTSATTVEVEEEGAVV